MQRRNEVTAAWLISQLRKVKKKVLYKRSGSYYNQHAMNTMTLPKERCKRCRFSWTPRVQKPRACPNCKRYDWDKDPKPEAR